MVSHCSFDFFILSRLRLFKIRLVACILLLLLPAFTEDYVYLLSIFIFGCSSFLLEF